MTITTTDIALQELFLPTCQYHFSSWGDFLNSSPEPINNIATTIATKSFESIASCTSFCLVPSFPSSYLFQEFNSAAPSILENPPSFFRTMCNAMWKASCLASLARPFGNLRCFTCCILGEGIRNSINHLKETKFL